MAALRGTLVTETSDQRQLLAIMFTDVVGYTALTERDEAAAVRVREQHRELIQTLVGQFDGEVVDATGDESLSVFPSALRAVDCALALQGALKSYPDLRVRVGIHLGDVLRREGEIIGEGVNIAARVRPLAEPGGITISEPVYQMVRTRSHLTAQALGTQTFKNVANPVEVYALAAAGAGPEPVRRRSRRRMAAALGLIAMLFLAVGLYPPSREAVVIAVVLQLPLILGESMEQEIGFAHNATDGVRIAYATTGQGPPIIMFSGWGTHLQEGIGSTAYDVDALVPLSSRRNLFVRFDGRGSGMSDRGVTNFSLEATVGDLAAVIDQLGVERVGIYASSAGGPTAIAYTARHPDRVSQLVLAGTFASTPWMSAEHRELLDRVLPLIRSSWEQPAVRNMLTDLIAPDFDGALRHVASEFMRRAGDGPAVAGFLVETFQHDVEDLARQITVPTLVIQGSDDQLNTVEAGQTLAALISGSRFELIEGGHLEAIGATPETRAHIIDFFAADATR
jgi:class 3 adenylate cyclase/pimeloyl-ACP methyl ester carboxylesterase